MPVYTFTLAIDLARFFASSPTDTQREAAIGAVDWGSATPGQIRTLDDALALHEERGTAHARRIAKELRERLGGHAPSVTQPAAEVAIQHVGRFYALDNGRALADYGDTGRSDDCASARARFLANFPGWRMATPAELGHADELAAWKRSGYDSAKRPAAPEANDTPAELREHQAILDADARDATGRTLRELASEHLSEWLLGDKPAAALNARYVPESVALELRRDLAGLRDELHQTRALLGAAERQNAGLADVQRERDAFRALLEDAYIVLAGATHPSCRKPGDVLSRIAAACPDLLGSGMR